MPIYAVLLIFKCNFNPEPGFEPGFHVFYASHLPLKTLSEESFSYMIPYTTIFNLQ